MPSIAPSYHDQPPQNDTLAFELAITITRSIVELKLNKDRLPNVSIEEIKQLSQRANLYQLSIELYALPTEKAKLLASKIENLLSFPAEESNVALSELHSLL